MISATLKHRWDEIQQMPTTITRTFLETMGLESIGHGIHESLLKSYMVLRHVKVMLERGDSPETIREFIEWAEQRVGKPTPVESLLNEDDHAILAEEASS